ncbi:MAG TPA: acyl carrier protein [Arcobacter sp.]|jgi:acyl carrier protein|nr:acyl carrier protein [Arcobacter sp.]
MTKEEILAKIEEIFRDVFNDDSLTISYDTNADDIEEWDSFNHINLVAAIEKAFNIKFALGELQELENVGDMIDLMIKEKL